MDRRNARLRREYLYRKSLETDEAAEHDKKIQLKEALESGKRIPKALQREADDLKDALELDDPSTQKLRTHIDDEYQNVGIYDPKILITSSRDPSNRLLQFVKELRLCLPNAQRINRGGTIISELVEICRKNDFSDLVLVHEHRGEPDGLIISHMPYGPTAYFSLSNCVLRHDIKTVDMGTVSEAFPHLVFHNMASKLGQRTASILKALYPVPKDDARRVMSFINRNDVISFRHHVYKKNGVQDRAAGKKEIELAEVGPRFEMRMYQIKLGTAEMTEAETEWVLRPYHNEAAKRQLIAGYAHDK